MSQSVVVKQRVFRSPAQWRDLLARFDAGGLTAVTFCRQQGLSISNFYRWRQALASRTKAKNVRRYVGVDQQALMSAPAFVELPAALGASPGFPPPQRWRIELDLGDGVVLRLAR